MPASLDQGRHRQHQHVPQSRARNLVVVTFEQDYRSSNLSNQMKKRQYWIKEDGRWKIVFEGARLKPSAFIFTKESFRMEKHASPAAGLIACSSSPSPPIAANPQVE
jgi:hypothetical protein